MQANFSGINRLTSFMSNWDLFAKVIISHLDFLRLVQSTYVIGHIHEIWQSGIKPTVNLSNGKANKQPNSLSQKHINMLGSHLFNGTNVTSDNE